MPALKEVVSDILDRDASVIIDLHNYFRYSPLGPAGEGAIVTVKDIDVVWRYLAKEFKALAQSHVTGRSVLMFNIMNEPHSMPSSKVLELTNAGIKAIRDEGVNNPVLVHGNHWSGLHSWTTNTSEGVSNAELFSRGQLMDQPTTLLLVCTNTSIPILVVTKRDVYRHQHSRRQSSF